MKRTILILAQFLFLIDLLVAQTTTTRHYLADLNNFTGTVEIIRYSEDIVHYILVIKNEQDHQVFKQESYAVNPTFNQTKDFGSELIEKEDGEQLLASQYFELCKCNESFIIKITSDNSIVKIDCKDSFTNKIFGGPVNQLKTKQSLGQFRLKTNPS